MLSQTYDLTAILELPISSGIDLIVHAAKKEQAQAAWDLWSRAYPLMAAGLIEPKSYDEFRDAMRSSHQTNTKSAAEIESELEPIIRNYEMRQ